MNALAWLLISIAAGLWPAARPEPADPPVPSDRMHGAWGPARRERLLVPAAGIGAAGATLAIGGVPSGLLAAVVVGPVAAIGVDWLRRNPRGPAPDRSLALCLDLIAAVLRSGRPVTTAILAAAPAAGPSASQELTRVARLLALGADPQQAWSGCLGPRSLLAPVAGVAVRSQESGIKLAVAFERLAAELRAECAATATARAYRAGVHAMGPLAACFLPSFVCLGIVPVVVGIAASATGTLV